MTVRAEHDSLKGYLGSVLTQDQLERPLLTNFNHWIFAQDALGEVAMTLHSRGSQVSVGFWADKTPMLDVAWETQRIFGTLLLSPTREAQVEKALKKSGLPKASFMKPPIRSWKPREPIHIPQILNRTNIRAMTYRGADVGRAILQIHPDRDTPTTDNHMWPRAWVEAAAESFAYVFDQTYAAIIQQNITMLAVYNGRFLHDRAAAVAAESLGIPVVSYDLGGHDTDFDLTIDDTHDWEALQKRMLNLYERWDPRDRDNLGSQWFLDRTQHLDKTNVRFTEAQKIGSMVELPENKRIIVFFSSSGDEIIELDLDWDSYFCGQESALLLVAGICTEDPDIYFIVRSHPHKRHKPKNDVKEWMAAVESAAPDLHLDPHSAVDSYELMRSADLVITYGSTSGVEAAFARKPVVVLGPSAYNSLGCAIQPIDESQLRRAIKNPEPGLWNGAVSYGLLMKRRGFIREHRSVFEEVKDTKPLIKNLSMIRRNRSFKKYLESN
ncbi:hypothetical protein N9R12_01080 [Actinomycetota bacterium]|nr:hypothetical protein [Actinomycetota bacterium]